MADKNYVFYCIFNNINNKRYIGRTINFKRRTNQHKSCLRRGIHANDFLQRDWDLFGEESFSFIIIDEMICDTETADIKEDYLINHYKSLDHNYGYNDRGGGINGSLTNHTKQKLREYRLGTTLSSETKSKMSKTRTGKKLSDTAKKKIGNAHRGKFVSEETIKKMLANRPDMSGENHPNYGKHLSDETKSKISNVLTGKYCGEDNPRATITEQQVLDIIDKLKNGKSIKHISLETGISKSKISDIKRGKSWKYLTKDIDFPKRVAQ